MSTPVGVIKNFVATLINSNESGEEALNEALKAVGAVNYDVLESRFSDAQSGLSTQDFLEQYCGIRVNNTDTGAITGSDAREDFNYSSETYQTKTRYSCAL